MYLFAFLKAGASATRVEDAHHAVVVMVRAGAEHHRRGPAEGAVTHHETPQAMDRDRVTGRVVQRAHECAGGRVKRVDPAIPEVPHEQVASKWAEACRSDR